MGRRALAAGRRGLVSDLSTERSALTKHRGLVVHYGAHPGATGMHLAEAATRLNLGSGLPRPHRVHVRLAALAAPSYVWVESGKTSLPIDAHLAPFTTCGYLIDAHLHPELSRMQANLFDIAFVAQRDLLEDVAAHHPNAAWLPLAAPRAFLDLPRSDRYDAAFVGNVVPGSKRERLLVATESVAKLNEWRRSYLPYEMAEVYAASRVVVNPPANGDLNMRFFEAMACGAMVVTAAIGNGQAAIAVEGRDFVTADFDRPDAVATAVAAASDRAGTAVTAAAERRRLVANGHTYDHRVRTIVAALQVAKREAPVRQMEDRVRARLLLDLAEAYEDASLLRHAVREARGRVDPNKTLRVVVQCCRRSAVEVLDARASGLALQLRRYRRT